VRKIRGRGGAEITRANTVIRQIDLRHLNSTATLHSIIISQQINNTCSQSKYENTHINQTHMFGSVQKMTMYGQGRFYRCGRFTPEYQILKKSQASKIRMELEIHTDAEN
jgi:hypothetical protein